MPRMILNSWSSCFSFPKCWLQICATMPGSWGARDQTQGLCLSWANPLSNKATSSLRICFKIKKKQQQQFKWGKVVWRTLNRVMFVHINLKKCHINWNQIMQTCHLDMWKGKRAKVLRPDWVKEPKGVWYLRLPLVSPSLSSAVTLLVLAGLICSPLFIKPHTPQVSPLPSKDFH